MNPASTGRKVVSATQTRSGAEAVKSRCKRFGAIGSAWLESVVRFHRLDELEAHFPLLAKKAAAFRRKSRSIVTVFSSRRSRVFSARSSLVSGPCGSFLSSISALFTQARTLVSVSPSSRDTAPTLLPLVRISFITSALYSFVNDLLALAMDSILHHIGGVHEIGAGSGHCVEAVGGRGLGSTGAGGAPQR